MYKLNRRGPKTDPCGTPAEVSRHLPHHSARNEDICTFCGSCNNLETGLQHF